jgi:hypothetical protein
MLRGIFIHIYLSTIGEPGTFHSVTHSAASEAWAWTFHPAWSKKVTERDPREAYEKAREQQCSPTPDEPGRLTHSQRHASASKVSATLKIKK